MREEIHKGIKDTWAAALGLIPLGLAFGLLMVQSGFSWWWTPIFSIVIYAGSMEFLAISMVTGGVSALSSLLTGFMVNFRHIFYGLTFPRHHIRSRVGRAYSTYALTDETYAIVSSLPTDDRPTGARILTIQIFCQALWVGGGIVGALAGQVIPSTVQGMEFALVALFVVLAMEASVEAIFLSLFVLMNQRREEQRADSRARAAGSGLEQPIVPGADDVQLRLRQALSHEGFSGEGHQGTLRALT